VLAVAGAAVGIVLFYVTVLADLPEINSLQDYRPNLITRVLDVDGNEIASFAKERRVIIPIEQVPKHVVDAFIAAEDGSFYEHKGLDYGGILRAAATNVLEGRKAQGASTITQQVAKTFLLTPERSYTRKLKDMVLARRIEESLSKNDILYLYLNQIYFGAGAYGIEAAAQTYFGKSARDLQVHEAAVIAGSLGMLASATVGGAVDLYEPVHGSAPDIAGRGIANPLGAIATAAMLLRFTARLEDEATDVEVAIRNVLDNGYRTRDIASGADTSLSSTSEMGQMVSEAIAEVADMRHAYHAV
jgi:hypothetical protein